MQETKETLDLITLRDTLFSLLHPYVTRIALFGSIVRGEETEQSDLDVLITLKPPEERPSLGLKWFDLEAELSHLVGRRVELVSDEALSPHIRPYMEQEKILLYEAR
jgi:hypothetical protein